MRNDEREIDILLSVALLAWKTVDFFDKVWRGEREIDRYTQRRLAGLLLESCTVHFH